MCLHFLPPPRCRVCGGSSLPTRPAGWCSGISVCRGVRLGRWRGCGSRDIPCVGTQGSTPSRTRPRIRLCRNLSPSRSNTTEQCHARPPFRRISPMTLGSQSARSLCRRRVQLGSVYRVWTSPLCSLYRTGAPPVNRARELGSNPLAPCAGFHSSPSSSTFASPHEGCASVRATERLPGDRC